MTPVSEAESILGRRNDRPIQYNFFPLPVFDSLRLLEDMKAAVVTGREFIDEEREAGTALSISNLEVVIPFLLQQSGALDEPLKLWRPSESGERTSRIGIELHSADALFSSIIQEMGGKGIPTVMPTEKNEKIARFQAASDGVFISQDDDQREIERKLVRAWEIYTNTPNPTPVKQGPTNYSYLPPPEVLSQTFDTRLYEEVHHAVDMLGRAWAIEVTSPHPITWEFMPEAFSYREIMIPVNFPDYRVQIRARLDSISRFRKEGEPLQSQLIDLKTGRRNAEIGGLAAEVRLRQAQLMWYIAERFTAIYFLGEKFFEEVKKLKARKHGFNITVSGDSQVYRDRLHTVAYRWFNRQTGEMELEAVEMNDEQRNEFETWFEGFGLGVNRYKKEIKGLIKEKIQFRLPTN